MTLIFDNPSDYRTSHIGKGKAISYAKQYENQFSTKHLYWQLEQEILINILAGYNTHEMHLLDFACGTGRVLNFLENMFLRSTGIDISQDMLEIASRVCKRSELIYTDITNRDFDLHEQYDVITAFRFFLNAQSSLKKDAMLWIRNHLKEGGIFICNFHLNPISLVGLYYGFYSSMHRTQKPNMVSIKGAMRLLSNSNFKIMRIYGYGYLFYRRSGIHSSATALLKVERGLMKFSWLTPFARNLLIVATKE